MGFRWSADMQACAYSCAGKHCNISSSNMNRFEQKIDRNRDFKNDSQNAAVLVTNIFVFDILEK